MPIRSGAPRLAFVVCLWMAPCAAAAQEADVRLEVAGGITRLEGGGIVDGRGTGALIGVGWRVAGPLTLAFEAGINRLARDVGLLAVSVEFLQAMAGGRVGVDAGFLQPFAQAFAGGSRIETAAVADRVFMTSGRFRELHAAWQVGGGVDVPIPNAPLAIRAGVDYRRVHAAAPFGQTRLQLGVVYRGLGQ